MTTRVRSNEKSPVALRLLRRLAPRAIEICEVWKDENPAFQTLAATTIPAAEQYIARYDAGAARRVERRIGFDEKHEAIATLSLAARGWITAAVLHVPALDPEELVAPTDRPDDVVAGAARLLGMAREGPLADAPFARALIDELSPLLETAQRGGRDARKIANEEQVAAWELRDSARALHAALKQLRILLRQWVGTSHLDYQRLRLARARAEEAAEQEIDAALEAGAAVEADAAIGATAADAPTSANGSNGSGTFSASADEAAG